MTRDAAAWSANDLDQRFDLGPRRDELTGLAATLDNLLGRIAASRRHEQRFAGEMAHELRTPIARMRGRAELALRAGPGGDEERAGALASVVAEVDRLTRRDRRAARRRPARDPTPPPGPSISRRSRARPPTARWSCTRRRELPRAEGDAEVVRRALAPLRRTRTGHARSRIELVLSAVGRPRRVAVATTAGRCAPAFGERASSRPRRRPERRRRGRARARAGAAARALLRGRRHPGRRARRLLRPRPPRDRARRLTAGVGAPALAGPRSPNDQPSARGFVSTS